MKIYEVTQTMDWESWTVIRYTTKKAAYRWIMQAYYKEWQNGNTDRSPYWPFFTVDEIEVFE